MNFEDSPDLSSEDNLTLGVITLSNGSPGHRWAVFLFLESIKTVNHVETYNRRDTDQEGCLDPLDILDQRFLKGQ